MSGLFSTPKIPKPEPIQPPPPVPTVDDAKKNTQESDLLLRRRGRAASMVNGMKGDTSTPSVGTKMLLGQ